MKAFTTLLLLLHGPDGHEILLNPRAIASMHAAVKGQPNKQFDADVRCVINTTDSKFVSVTETCDEVRQQIKEK
jgi:hypothetical protein